MIDETIITAHHNALTPELREYLNQRHIADDIIDTLKIGFAKLNGFYWLTFPILDEDGKCVFLKLKRPPEAPDDQAKGMTYPSGAEATLYPLPYLTEQPDGFVLAEGEPDVCALMSHGITALCSTHGCGTWNEEWCEWFPHDAKIILAYDMDDAGKAGQEKVIAMFKDKRPDIHIGILDWHKCFAKWGNDVTDWFMHPMLWHDENGKCPKCDSSSTDDES
jgi:DNA primase